MKDVYQVLYRYLYKLDELHNKSPNEKVTNKSWDDKQGKKNHIPISIRV